MTPYEFSILTDYKRKTEKNEYQILRNVIYNAGLNLMRGKGEKEMTLFDEPELTEINDIDEIKKEREDLFG